MQKIKCKIYIHNPWLVQPHRENNKNIMDAVMNDNNITSQNRHIINKCRIFMQHTYLSEITSSDGTQIAQQIYNQYPPKSLDHQPEHDWPRQSKPCALSWKKYMGVIKRIFCKQNGKLHSPLGNWLRQSDKWNWRYNHDNKTIH